MVRPRVKIPGLRSAIAACGFLVALGVVTALERTAMVDEALMNQSESNAPKWPEMRIELNRATAAELALLPGIGPRLAERIVLDRDLHGRFASCADLHRVEGVGAATIERITPWVIP